MFQPKIKEDKMMKVPQESVFNHCGETLSANTTQKHASSLKSSTKLNSKNQESTFDLKIKNKNGHTRQQSKSMLENKKKQKSSVNLSHKIKSSSVIR